MWCIVGVVVFHTNAPFGYFLSFLGQEGSAPNSKILLHFNYIYGPLSIKINVEMGELSVDLALLYFGSSSTFYHPAPTFSS